MISNQTISARAAIVLAALFGIAGAVPTDQKAVEYGKPGGHSLLLDLRVPDGQGPFPAAILVHGGGFDGGSRATNMAPMFQPLADAGFAWFSIDYRMAPEFRFAEAREDLDTAIKWVKANARTYKVDPTKIVLAGESAGGFLVNYAGTHETPATKVAAVVDIYGPVDYEKIARQRQAYPARFNMASISAHQKTGGSIWFFGVEGYDEASYAKLKEISPIYAVHKGMPPFLAIHGRAMIRFRTSSHRCCATRCGKWARAATSSPSKRAAMAWARGRTRTSSITKPR